MAHDDQFGTARMERGSGREVDDFASHVISVLCERQPESTATGTRQFILDYLVRIIVSPRHFDPVLTLDELRGYRLTLDAIIDLYIPRAAARLGELWIQSELTFADVTIGALRLQAVLGEAASDQSMTGQSGSTDAFSALIIVPKDEQHFLGATVVAAQLRRLGCDTSLSFSETNSQIVDRCRFDNPDMILFSCARPEALETVSKTIKRIRRSMDPAPVIALGGAVRGDIDQMALITGVDLVTNAAKDVVGLCTKRLKALTKD